MKHFKQMFQIFAVLGTCLGYFYIYGKDSLTKESASHFNKFKPLRNKLIGEKRVALQHTSTYQACENVLSNLTRGKWRRDPSGNVSYYDALYAGYWRNKKILKDLWRGDGKCGLENPQAKIEGSQVPPVPSWCDPYGKKPCCSHSNHGVCSLPSNNTCECNGCVDLRKYLYAEISRWETDDLRCKWTNYSSIQACDVIRESPYDDIYFVGDSLMRNMFMTLSMLLSSDPVRGAWGKVMNEQQKKVCVAEEFFFWDNCRTLLGNLGDLVYPEKLCGGTKPNFSLNMLVYFNNDYRTQFFTAVSKLLGKKGSLVMVAVGLHFSLNANTVIGDYLNPAVKAIEDFHKDKNVTSAQRWPRIFFFLPLNHGILKQKVYRASQSNAAVARFSARMTEYCRQHEIPLFDFRQLSHHVHSFDGTHFGLGVNLLKNQILLNYLASETKRFFGAT